MRSVLPLRIRGGVAATGAMEYGSCQGNHDIVDAESHLVNTVNGQGMAQHEQSPPDGGRKHI